MTINEVDEILISIGYYKSFERAFFMLGFDLKQID
jgi:hypothetical protein